MGGKNKKSNQNRNVRDDNNAVRTQPDMSKYAGAVSNKSKRNYADLRLVRPDNLKAYASSGDFKSRDNSGDRRNKSSVTKYGEKNDSPKKKHLDRPKSGVPPRSFEKSRSISKKKSKSVRSSYKAVSNSQFNKFENYIGSFANILGNLASSSFVVKKNSIGKKPMAKNSKNLQKKHNSEKLSAKHTSAKQGVANGYTQDEYSKALNNSDFYSSVVEKYYMKHPEEFNKREKSHSSKKRINPNKTTARKEKRLSEQGSIQNKSATTVKSVAEIAVKGRGTSNKKQRAQVVKSGKAKGVVSSRVAHRRVQQRNRRRTVIFNSVMIMTTVVFLIAVYVTVFFNVKNIEVTGESPYDSNKIVSMCGFDKGDNILFVDAKKSENQIINSLPYIESCTIKRRLPATVVVSVTEAEILGVTEIASNQWAVISNKGKILETVTNLTVVSSSDVITSLTYDPEVSSVAEVAAKRNIPVIEGLEVTSGTAGGHINDAAIEQISDFDAIASEAKAFNMKITRISSGDKGYEMEYDGRINIVLGEISDRNTMKQRIETANYILHVSGDIKEHDRGEITYIKNKTYYNPTYET